MADLKLVKVELIDDNPFQPRISYSNNAIEELAASIEEHGLLQPPAGRQVDGRVQLVFGHMRRRAFSKLAKKDPRKWGSMPVEVREMSDEQMALFALEENLKRSGISPIEVARAVDSFLGKFPDKTESQMARSLHMTQGNISNMRRVLRLPAEVLEKVDSGRINFTMARELLALEALDGAKDKMLEAVSGIRTENGQYGEPPTVEGMQRCVNAVANRCLAPLQDNSSYYHARPLFDTSACNGCEKIVRTHPTKSQTYRWCPHQPCWDRKQQEHIDTAAAQARARMRQDMLQRGISQEIAGARDAPRSQVDARPAESAAAAGAKSPEPAPPGELPPELQKLAEEKAGTRAEVLDLKDIAFDSYNSSLKAGYAMLYDVAKQIEDPEECAQRCIKGFHYAFDSRVSHSRYNPGDGATRVYQVCSNPQCLSQKKAALTRARNAVGQLKKKAESAAIREALESTTAIDKPRMLLVLQAQLSGWHVSRYYQYSGQQHSPARWLRQRLQLDGGADEGKIVKAAEKLAAPDLARLVVELMLETLRYQGDTHDYEIQTGEALGWLGVSVAEHLRAQKAKAGGRE